jgi:NitT/TauT family transport system substrate-binding protein
MPTRPEPAAARRHRRRRPSRLLIALVAAIALLGAGCGGDSAGDDPGGGGGDGDLTKVTVGILPIADVAPIWYGIDKGYFAEEGLEIETVPAQGGAAIVPSVLSGEYQFGFGNVVSLMLARQNNVPVKIVSNLVNGADSPDRGTNALLVAPDSGIESLEDMAGKTFAVTTQKNVGEVTIKATLRGAGVDTSGIQFAEYGFPNMNAMVQSGEVDVAWQAEPFITLGKDAGLKVIADPMYGTMPDLTIASLFASEAYLNDHADVANRFKRAMARSITEAAADDEGARAIIADNTQTPPAVLERIALANWQAEVNRESLELQGKLAAEFDVLDEEPDIDALIWAP